MASTPTTSERRRRRSQYGVSPPWLSWKRIVAAVTAVVVVGGGVFGIRVVSSLGRVFHTDALSTVRTLVGGHGNSAVAQMVQQGKRINIALYGYGGQGHDGAYLTDSIMVVSILPQGSAPPRIAEISIPRDWWVPIDVGDGRNEFGRVNEAYESGIIGAPHHSSVYHGEMGGGQLADATLERMLGIHIDYFVGLDFTAFKSAVDSVGGIDVNVEHTFTDRKYPHGECDGDHPDCAYMTVHFDAGRQHMDGARALIFARSRESTDPQEGTNFARNKRQQLVLNAVKQRVLSVGGLGNLPDLLSGLGDHVITDIPLDSALSLYDITKGVDTKAITHISIDDDNLVHECDSCDASVEFPYDRTFATVHHFIDSVFVPGDVLAEKAPISVEDGSGRAGGAQQRWVSLLGSTGLQAADGGTHRYSATTHVVDASGGRNTRTARWLAAYFGVGVESQPAGDGTSTTSSSTRSGGGGGSASTTANGVILVLGNDEERSFNAGPGLYR